LLVTQDGVAKTIKPELTTRFDDEFIVLEKWVPKKPISAVYWEADKERYYVKRFLIEHEDREEQFIGDHEKSYLELVSTDYIPQVELVFSKIRGKELRENQIINIEEFISVKGVKALGNQLTTEKIKQINLLEPTPYEVEEVVLEDLEVQEEEVVEGEENKKQESNSSGVVYKEKNDGEESQTKLFDE
jgi:topoisomerase-4 subunit A